METIIFLFGFRCKMFVAKKLFETHDEILTEKELKIIICMTNSQL